MSLRLGIISLVMVAFLVITLPRMGGEGTGKSEALFAEIEEMEETSVEDGDPICISDAVIRISREHGIPPQLVNAIIHVESQGNPNAVSKKGALGLMQLMPVLIDAYKIADPFDPLANIEAGVRHLKYLLTEFSGDLPMALAAYNAGPGTVRKYGGVPPYPETRLFLRDVLKECQRELNELGLLVKPLRADKGQVVGKKIQKIPSEKDFKGLVAFHQEKTTPPPDTVTP